MNCSISLKLPKSNSTAASEPAGAKRVASMSALLEEELVLDKVFRGDENKAIQVYPPDCCLAAEPVWKKFEEARTIVYAWDEKHGSNEKLEEVLFFRKPDTGG